MSTEIDSLLASTPNIRNGQRCVSGTGISVNRIAILHNLGHSTEDIVRKYEPDARRSARSTRLLFRKQKTD